MIGADERASSATGYRESPQSWHKLLVDLRHRGLEIGPKLAIGDGNLGSGKRYTPS